MRIFDSLKNKSIELIPSRALKILVCGPTASNYCHLGHARVLVIHNTLNSFLKYAGFSACTIVNITDIDPKILKKAELEESTPSEIASKFTKEFFSDCIKLELDNLFYVKVSDYLENIENLIIKLIDDNNAYFSGNMIYLDIDKFKPSCKSFANFNPYNRYDIARGKRSPKDIKLWDSEIFEYGCPSKILGNGIPWWHIQDTALALFLFNGLYDIHGGGIDLVEPHHQFHLFQLNRVTNNISPVKAWLHNGIVKINGEKISSSTKSFLLVRDLLKRYRPNTLKLYLLSFEYSKDIVFNTSDITKYSILDYKIEIQLNKNNINEDRRIDENEKKLLKDFENCLNNNFNTGNAIKILEEVVDLNYTSLIHEMINILGLKYYK